MPATIRDVARKAGVGLGTVSRVLNQSPQVSVATRQRVLDAIDELDYTPNHTARRLSLGKTHTIAAIIPFFTRPAAVERLRGVTYSISGTEYDLIVANIETPERRVAAFRELARRERVDGVLVISLPFLEKDAALFKRSGIPLVIIDVNDPDLHDFNRIVVDDIEGARKGVQHLLDLGHTNIGYISDVLEESFPFSASRARFTGYCQALEAAGLNPLPATHRHGEHSRFDAKIITAEMLRMTDRPTAIFAASDTQAIGVMEAAREQGLRIPEDLSVLGYDDVEIAEHLGLTTVRQLLIESGEIGVRLLLEIIEDPLREPECEILPTELIIRNTTAPPS
ncbi:MAG: LacI family transcriptional regulator [Anaerolineales bacterium]|nr:LacI family transcriptional regulator [Anaerolineales bacterium]